MSEKERNTPLPSISTFLKPNTTPVNEVTPTTSTEGSQKNEYTKVFYLKFSLFTHPFGLPPYPEVANEGKNQFADPGLKCLEIKSGAETIYKFLLSKKVKREGQFLNFKCAGVDLKFPMLSKDPTQKGARRHDGILLTFKFANLPAEEEGTGNENEPRRTTPGTDHIRYKAATVRP